MKPYSVSAHMGGFTPIVDHMVEKYGLTTAAVFGIVWRHCQMSHGVCHARQENLAALIGISRQAFNKHLRILVDVGYLEDLTPDIVNRAHTYKDTGKANIVISVSATVNEDDTNRLSNRQDSKEKRYAPSRLVAKNTQPESELLSARVDIQSIHSDRMMSSQVEARPTLFEKIAEEIRKQGRAPDMDLIREACRRWSIKRDQAEQDGKDWNVANLDAILEFYDMLTLSTEPIPDWKGTTYFRDRRTA